MYNDNNSAPTIVCTLFTSNSAIEGGIGSAIYSNADSYALLRNCTIAQNYDSNSGPVAGISFSVNCILCESIKTPYANGLVNNSMNTCELSRFASKRIVPVESIFVDKMTGNFRLKPGSSAINAGESNLGILPILDLAGQLRIQDNAVDIGAYEFTCLPVACLPISAARKR